MPAPGPPSPRAIVGRALVVSAMVMLVLAVAFVAGALPLDPAMRTPVGALLGLVAALDLIIGLWFIRRYS